jgi:hypothetical protein
MLLIVQLKDFFPLKKTSLSFACSVTWSFTHNFQDRENAKDILLSFVELHF